jgi:hypothetical protein
VSAQPAGQRAARDGVPQAGHQLLRRPDSHVRSILNKLGFSSRAQIAAWLAAD